MWWLLCKLALILSLTTTRRLGRGFGRLVWWLRIRRSVTISNLTMALGLGQTEARQLARRVYEQLGCGALEFLRIGGMTRDDAREMLGAESLERLTDALRSGKGALVLSAHLGNWDLLACAAALGCNTKVNVITRSIKSSWLNRFWMSQRARCGVRLLPAQNSAMAIRAALRRNEIVAFVIDQHQPDGVVVPFFGHPAATTTAVARLARAMDAPVLPAFLLRTSTGFRFDLHEALLCQRGPSASRDAHKNTRNYSNIIESEIRRHPEQWLWLHRRWKVAA